MLLSIEELHARLGEPQLVIFDCRFQLSDVTLGRRQYDFSHIPGAHYLDLEADLSGPVQAHGGRHPLPDAKELAAKFGLYGVDQQTTVVLYDAGEGMVTRAWWLLRYYGHDKVYVLNGGWNAWANAGYATTAKASPVDPKVFPLRIQPDMIATNDHVVAISRGEVSGVLLDARAPERYRGEVEPLDPKAGHIPGAINLPWSQWVQDGYWSPVESDVPRASLPSLTKAETAAGPVVAYCGSGVTACALLFELELSGMTVAKLYPGSWSDWCSYPQLPVATGDKASS